MLSDFVSPTLNKIYHIVYKNIKSKDNLITELRKNIGTIGDINFDSRIINHWFNQGLINTNTQKYNKGWHKFSAIDEIFIKIAQELRKFGLNLNKIRTTKESLEEYAVLKDETGRQLFETVISLLEAAIIYAKTTKTQLYILADETGRAQFVTKNILTNAKLPCCYICLNFTGILDNSHLVEKVFKEIQPNKQNTNLTEAEQQILNTLKQPNLESLTVKKDLNTGLPVRMNAVKDITHEKEPIINFGEIQEKIANGKQTKKRVIETTKLN